MKTTLALILCVAVAAVSAEQMYTTRFDNVDVDQILHNDRLLKRYLGCILRDEKCTPDATELKRLLPDALTTNCEKCSPKQKEGAKKVITFLSKNKPQEWSQIMAKYDPQNIFRTKYAEQAKQYGVAI